MSTSQIDLTASRDSHPARRAMIDSQLRPSGVTAAYVLAAMAGVAREDFVPLASRPAAYIDRAIALDNGRWLPAPLVQARMLEEAAPALGDMALLVGTGNAYLPTLLRPLVTRLDVIEAGAECPAGPYDLIVIDGAVEVLPEALGAALADGGRLVTGLVERGVTRLAVARKQAGTIAFLRLAEIGIPVLPEFAALRRWSF